MINSLRIFPLLVAGLLLVSCKPAAVFPAIKDGERLRRDCVWLLENFPEGEISKDKWLQSLQALKPIRVNREPQGIRIWVYEKRGKMAGGYYVLANLQMTPPNQGVWLAKTETKGIYTFKVPF